MVDYQPHTWLDVVFGPGRRIIGGTRMVARLLNEMEDGIVAALRKDKATMKGDLFVATGPGVVDRLGVGGDGEVLTADPAQAVGMKWAPPTGGSSYPSLGITQGKNLFDQSTAVAGQFWNGGSTTIALAGWSATPKIPITPGTTYTVNNARNYQLFDANGNVLSGSFINNPAQTPLTFTAPAGAVAIGYNIASTAVSASQLEVGSSATSYEPYGAYISRELVGGRYASDAIASGVAARKALGLTVYKSGSIMLIRSPFGDGTQDVCMPVNLNGQITAGGETMLMLSDLTGGGNPNVVLIPSASTDAAVWPTLTVTTTPIHNPTDDNCPINVQWSYVGANHGYSGGSKVTMTAHGKTNADRGSQWTDATRTFTLLQVIDANTLLFGNQYTVTSGVVTGDTHLPAASLTHVSGATNTATVTITGGVALAELHPVTSNRTVNVKIDGRPLADGTTTGQALTAVETYSIVSYKALIDYSRANIGADPFAAIATLGQLATIRNTYVFTPAQVLVAQSVTAVEAMTANVGVTQTIPLTVPSGGSKKQFMAGVGTAGGLNFSTLADLSTMTADIAITSANLLTAGNPAQRMTQWAYNSGGSPQYGLSVGILPTDDGTVYKRSQAAATSWFISNSYKKNYPYVAYQKAMAVGDEISGTAWRRYLVPPDTTAELVITDGTRSWAVLDRPSAASSATAMNAPTLLDRRLVTIGASTVTARDRVTGGGIVYTCTAPGYALWEAVPGGLAARVPADVTAARLSPAGAGVGATMFDTTLGQPIWSDGGTWRDATGAEAGTGGTGGGGGLVAVSPKAGHFVAPAVQSTSNGGCDWTYTGCAVVLSKTTAVTSLSVNITTAGPAGTQVRLSLYAADADGYPATRVATVVVAGDATGYVTGTFTAVDLPPGIYSCAIQPSDTTTIQVEGGRPAFPLGPYGALNLAFSGNGQYALRGEVGNYGAEITTVTSWGAGLPDRLPMLVIGA